jgi:hypothetical protein
MTHKLIKTDNYLLVVDDSEIKLGDWIYDSDCQREDYKVVIANKSRVETSKVDACNYYHKIIAYLPLNGSPILEGVDLLPALDNDIIGKPMEDYVKEKHNQDRCVGFIDGYQAAREKYKYTEEDIRMAISAGLSVGYSPKFDIYDLGYEVDNIIKSLNQYPTEFECEMEVVDTDWSLGDVKTSTFPKTITSTKGIQWVGKYK